MLLFMGTSKSKKDAFLSSKLKLAFIYWPETHVTLHGHLYIKYCFLFFDQAFCDISIVFPSLDYLKVNCRIHAINVIRYGTISSFFNNFNATPF